LLTEPSTGASLWKGARRPTSRDLRLRLPARTPQLRACGSGAHRKPAGKTEQCGTTGLGALPGRVLTQDGHAGHAYVINGPQALTAREQVQILADILGRPIELVPLTPEQFAQRSIA
jgi:hypothetical protein